MTENKTMKLKNKAEVEYMNYLINLEINGVQFIKLSKSSSEFNITVPENAEQLKIMIQINFFVKLKKIWEDIFAEWQDVKIKLKEIKLNQILQ